MVSIIRLHTDDRRRGRFGGKPRGRTASCSYADILLSRLLEGAGKVSPAEGRSLYAAFRELNLLPRKLPRCVAANEAQLRQIEDHVRDRQRELGKIVKVQLPCSRMPGVPILRVPIPAAPSTSPLPAGGGIYFFWDGDECMYLGKSRQLRDRATVTHEQAESHFVVSWVERHAHTVGLDELYFIWLLRPTKNRGH
jgi:hypothetical protein